MKTLRTGITIKVSVLVCCLLIFDQDFTLAQNWVKKFARFDKLADKGDYKLARELNHNLKIRLRTKLGLQNPYNALAHFKDAKYFAGAGYFNAYRRSINSGFSSARGVTGRNNLDYAKIALVGIAVMVNYEDFAKAATVIKEIETIFEDFNTKNQHLLNQKDLLKAYILAGQGHTKEALTLLNDLEDYVNAIAKQEYMPDFYSRVNQGKMRDLLSYEKKVNKRKYVDYLLNYAEALSQSGQNAKADSLLNYSEKWASANIGGKDQSTIWVKYKQFQRVYPADTNQEAIPKLTRLTKQARSGVNKNHELALTLNYHLLTMYQTHGKRKKYKSLKEDLAKINTKYYDDKNIHPYELSLVALNEEVPDIDPELLYKGATKLLADAKAIPDFHNLRVRYLEFLHQKAEALNLEAEAAAYKKEIAVIEKAIYGENSPKLLVGNE